MGIIERDGLGLLKEAKGAVVLGDGGVETSRS